MGVIPFESGMHLPQPRGQVGRPVRLREVGQESQQVDADARLLGDIIPLDLDRQSLQGGSCDGTEQIWCVDLAREFQGPCECQGPIEPDTLGQSGSGEVVVDRCPRVLVGLPAGALDPQQIVQSSLHRARLNDFQELIPSGDQLWSGILAWSPRVVERRGCRVPLLIGCRMLELQRGERGRGRCVAEVALMPPEFGPHMDQVATLPRDFIDKGGDLSQAAHRA